MLDEELKKLVGDLASADEMTRRYAVEDLGDLGDVNAIEPLVDLLGDESPAMRESVVDALVSIGGRQTVESVAPLLRSEDPSARNAACQILERIGEDSIGTLEQLLEDEDKDVRKFAVDVLTLIGSASSEAAFLRALTDEDVNVAAAAAEALGHIQSTNCLDRFAELMDSHVWMRCSIAKSLGRIGGEPAVNTLGDLVREEDPIVVYSAVEALAGMQCDASRKILQSLVDHHDELVAMNARRALEKSSVGSVETPQPDVV